MNFSRWIFDRLWYEKFSINIRNGGDVLTSTTHLLVCLYFIKVLVNNGADYRLKE